MKKLISLLLMLLVIFSCSVTAFAADGNVTYTGNSGSIIFAPGSDESLTDLFPNFKGVMPGDSLEQKITIKNNASNNVKVKLYILVFVCVVSHIPCHYYRHFDSCCRAVRTKGISLFCCLTCKKTVSNFRTF